MNNQEAFNTAYTHLLKQNQRALGADIPTCQYRNDTGLKCAVGALFPDELYEPRMDAQGYTAVQLLDDFPTIAKHFEGVDPCLLYELQRIHDRTDVEQWPDELTKLAANFKLTLPTP